jgi:hypothetical protein
MFFNFEHERFLLVPMDDQGIVDTGQVASFESNIDNNTDCPDDDTLIFGFE